MVNYSNPYTFLISFGLIAFFFFCYNINLLFQTFNYFAFVFLFLTLCLVLYGAEKWLEAAKIKDRIDKRKLEIIEPKLDFDIVSVEAQQDLDWIPDDFDQETKQPIYSEPYLFVKYTININIFNPSIKNFVRKIEVWAKDKNKKTKCSNVTDFSPMEIQERGHVQFKFNVTLDNSSGGFKEDILVVITPMEGKPQSKEFHVKSYSYSRAYGESMGIPFELL